MNGNEHAPLVFPLGEGHRLGLVPGHLVWWCGLRMWVGRPYQRRRVTYPEVDGHIVPQGLGWALAAELNAQLTPDHLRRVPSLPVLTGACGGHRTCPTREGSWAPAGMEQRGLAPLLGASLAACWANHGPGDKGLCSSGHWVPPQPVEATDDAFWDQFWADTATSVQDVFALVPAAEIRAVREESPSNLATLCYKVRVPGPSVPPPAELFTALLGKLRPVQPCGPGEQAPGTCRHLPGGAGLWSPVPSDHGGHLPGGLPPGQLI